jgi:asparagine synthetase B (glutamine-hydrolysing)
MLGCAVLCCAVLYRAVLRPQEEFFQETVRKVQALYKYDCLRANKSTMAW